jgi:Raf kinase inhibitor-like YbhB/YbcL family protein
MRLLRNMVMVLVLAVVAVLAWLIWHASNARDDDAAFHAGLTRSLGVRSSGFSAGADIPPQFTCKGAGTSPQIAWSDVPPQTASLVLISVDWDVPSPAFRLLGFTHWTLFDIPPGVTEVDAGNSVQALKAKGISSGLNSGGSVGYMPMCPPMGIHKYIFRVYALDVAQLQPASPERGAIIDAMKGHVLGYGELSAFFSK